MRASYCTPAEAQRKSAQCPSLSGWSDPEEDHLLYLKALPAPAIFAATHCGGQKCGLSSLSTGPADGTNLCIMRRQGRQPFPGPIFVGPKMPVIGFFARPLPLCGQLAQQQELVRIILRVPPGSARRRWLPCSPSPLPRSPAGKRNPARLRQQKPPQRSFWRTCTPF